ncbi:2,3-bisphosphoglycerate-dependent phosphoglycerate mutase [Methylobacterium thuringiense]
MAPAPRRRLVLMRHGESEANSAGLFTGRLDPPLTFDGGAEADAVGRYLMEKGCRIDFAISSPLLRTVDSCRRVLAAAGMSDVRMRLCSGIVERDYGDLSGLSRASASIRWGADQVDRWRRSYTAVPPGGESLRDTVSRVVPAYLREILPCAMRGTTLVVGHGNSLRALIMALEDLTPEQIEDLELPPAGIRSYDLADDTTIVVSGPLGEAAPARVATGH